MTTDRERHGREILRLVREAYDGGRQTMPICEIANHLHVDFDYVVGAAKPLADEDYLHVDPTGDGIIQITPKGIALSDASAEPS